MWQWSTANAASLAAGRLERPTTRGEKAYACMESMNVPSPSVASSLSWYHGVLDMSMRAAWPLAYLYVVSLAPRQAWLLSRNTDIRLTMRTQSSSGIQPSS